MITAAQAAEKHNRNLKNATADIENGIKAVTVSPTAEAAKKIDKMLAGIQEAVRSGKLKRSLEGVSLEDWRKAAIEVGIPRISAGIDAARGDVESFFNQLLPYIEKVQAKIRTMPDMNFQDSIARMVENAKQMRDFKRS